MVDETSCHLTGAIDSAGPEIRPFGQNPYSLQALTGTVHLMTGWRRYDDYGTLHDIFCRASRDEVGDLSAETMETIKSANVKGLLLSRGFTSLLANKPQVTSIRDDVTGLSNMLSLDGILVNPGTRFDDPDCLKGKRSQARTRTQIEHDVEGLRCQLLVETKTIHLLLQQNTDFLLPRPLGRRKHKSIRERQHR